jgi:hypothetical protein
MTKEEMAIVRRVVGSVTSELEEKTYLRKDVKLILLEVIKRLEDE